MKTIKTSDFKRSLTALRRKRAAWFARHPEEEWREVRLMSPDNKQWAIVKLKNPSLSPSGLPTEPCHPSQASLRLRHLSPVGERVRSVSEEGEDTEPHR